VPAVTTAPFFVLMFTGRQAWIILLLIATVVLLFQNAGHVRLKFAFFNFSLPLPVLIIAAIGIGIVLGFWLDRPKSNAKKK
jgi:uncharacterized integral membrane protein